VPSKIRTAKLAEATTDPRVLAASRRQGKRGTNTGAVEENQTMEQSKFKQERNPPTNAEKEKGAMPH